MSVQRRIESFSDIAANDSQMVTLLFALTVHVVVIVNVVFCFRLFRRQTELFAKRLRSKQTKKKVNRLYNIAEE